MQPRPWDTTCNGRRNMSGPSLSEIHVVVHERLGCLLFCYQLAGAILGGHLRNLIQSSDLPLPTGDESTIEVEVVPNGVSRSISDPKCSTERTCTFMMKESAPVPRWHSTTSGEFFTTAVIRVKTSPTTDMRMKAVIGIPTFIGSISA